MSNFFSEEDISFFRQELKGTLECNDICSHKNQVIEDGVIVCQDCGKEKDILTYDREWKTYNTSSNRLTKNPERCSLPKTNDKYKAVLEEMNTYNVGKTVKNFASKIFVEVTENNTTRNKCRKGLIAACLYLAFIKLGDVRTATEIRAICDGIEQKRFSSGLTLCYEKYREYLDIEITALDIIKRTVILSGISFHDHYERIMKLAKYIDKSSRELMRSNPQSVAAGIIYFYLEVYESKLKKEKALTLKEFSEKVNLSEITVKKMCKIISTKIQTKKN